MNLIFFQEIMAGAITKIQGLLKTIDAVYWIKNV